MTKGDFVRTLSHDTGFTKDKSEIVLNAVLRIISDALASGEEVRIPGFGTFKVKTQGARTRWNPADRISMSIPEKRVPCFTPSKMLKDAVGS